MTSIAVDTSALLAILQGEPDAEAMEQCLFASKGDIALSGASLLEALIVIESRNPATGATDLRSLLEIFDITVEPVTHDHAEIAFRAWKRFGRGRHPAALNFGDCFAYALSRDLAVPLLYNGQDFSQTDVPSAL